MKRAIRIPASTIFREIPPALVAILTTPVALLSQGQRRSVALYEAIMKYELFGSRAITWNDALTYPEKRIARWTRCPTCESVLETYPVREILCTKCAISTGRKTLWD